MQSSNLSGLAMAIAHNARWTGRDDLGKPGGRDSFMGTEKRRAQRRRSRNIYGPLSALRKLEYRYPSRIIQRAAMEEEEHTFDVQRRLGATGLHDTRQEAWFVRDLNL